MSKLQQIKAKQLAEAEKTGSGPYAPGKTAMTAQPLDFAHYKEQLKEDVLRLSALPSIEEKIALKRDLIKRYRTFIDAYIAAGEQYPNPVAVRVMIWLFDVQDIESALTLALRLIDQKCQVMPDGFSSTMTTFICDYTYDWASALLKKGQSASPYLDDVVAVMDRQAWLLAPPVQSKMYAMLAKHKEQDGDFRAVVALCDQAAACNPDGHGTKTLRTRAMAKL